MKINENLIKDAISAGFGRKMQEKSSKTGVISRKMKEFMQGHE